MTEKPLPTDAAERSIRPVGFVVALLLLTLLSLVMRGYNLGNSGFWIDEVFSVYRVCDNERGVNKRILGYVPIWLALEVTDTDLRAMSSEAPERWKAAGLTPWRARVGPMWVGVLTVPLLVLASRRILGDRAALVFGLLLAIAPWHLYWSQNARFYTPLFLFANLSFFLYYGATELRSNWRMFAALVCLGCAVLSHQTGIFFAAAMGADWLIGHIRRRPVALGWVGWTAVALGAAYAILQVNSFMFGEQYEKIRTQGGYYSPIELVMGFTYLTQVIVVCAAGLGAWLVCRDCERRGWYLLMGAVMPMVVLILASFFAYAHFRYAFIALGPALALAAVGLDRIYAQLRRGLGPIPAWAPLGLVVVTCLVTCLFYYSGGQGFRLRWDDAFAYVEEHSEPGDAIYSDYPQGASFYLERGDVEYLGSKYVAPKDPGVTAWYIFASQTSSSYSREEAAVREHAELVAYFDTHVEEPYSSVRVYRYQPPSGLGGVAVDDWLPLFSH